MKPIVNRLREKYAGKVEFRIYNVDKPGSEGSNVANEMGVQYLPTLLFANADGTIVGQQVGEMSEAALDGRIGALK